ncbi:ubiquinol oxidase subunit II [Agrobacterium sp. B1(2019)]|uniref:ubiquinol oxidase subunit II n=1 Tax=Agrobacterium sp. B1(2019) TaxID=2607032 RepID=UPI0011EFC273|nr:ubiquinol oxidase subunit II [Agrobacterium sp. B1(2019)]TZG36025.1 ubiquinol oxidase subunit II [Agrobacterium sp. B1(2019)]
MAKGKLNRTLVAVLGLSFLAGCNSVVLRPAGDVATQQRDLLVFATALILVIIVPLIAAVLIFVWRYRASGNGPYDPETKDSARLTALVWSGPLVIIVVLAITTWFSTHRLDPYRPLDRIGPGRHLAASDKPMVVQVIALDWKWLFIYPEHGIAVVNEVAAPVDVPIRFEITASSVMNSFFVPALAGQIYAMPGMETRLNAVFNRPGSYEGFSANYSGAGFSKMRFKALGLDRAEFQAWIDRVKAGTSRLDSAGYLALSKPSEAEPVRYYAAVDEALYPAILNMCVGDPGACSVRTMHHARAGHADVVPATIARSDADRRRSQSAAAIAAEIGNAPICRASPERDAMNDVDRIRLNTGL